MDPIHRFELKVTEAVLDGNGHVNNVAYVQWMQDAAMRHAEATGGTAIAVELGATWVVRAHHVEYLRPAFAGDTLLVMTWVADFRRVQSLRKYRFFRVGEPAALVKAETDWVFLDASTGRLRTIPERIKNAFHVVAPDQEPQSHCPN